LFNKRTTIRRTVVSVLAQSFDDFELIVVDDGSTDGSIDELADVADPRLTIIGEENLGEGPARNRGIESAHGEWIALLDADDVWMPYHLDEIDRVRTRFPDAGMIGTRWIEVDADAIPPQLPRGQGEPEEIRYFEEALKAPILCSSTVAIRRAAFDDVGDFRDLPVGADIEFWARVALKWPVARSPVVTAFYLRSNKASQTTPKSSSPPEQETVQGTAAVIELLRRERDAIDKTKRAAIDRYIRVLWKSRFRYLVSREELGRARHLATIAPTRLSLFDRLRLLAIRMPDAPAIKSIRMWRRVGALLMRN
jgi:glycosyltransferase involved in cell wall biosynthesis